MEFDFKFKLANEFQEIDFLKSLIEDVDSVSDLVVAGKALQLREKAEVKEEQKIVEKVMLFGEKCFGVTAHIGICLT